jgi:hypothetical protein
MDQFADVSYSVAFTVLKNSSLSRSSCINQIHGVVITESLIFVYCVLHKAFSVLYGIRELATIFV